MNAAIHGARQCTSSTIRRTIRSSSSNNSTSSTLCNRTASENKRRRPKFRTSRPSTQTRSLSTLFPPGSPFGGGGFGGGPEGAGKGAGGAIGTPASAGRDGREGREGREAERRVPPVNTPPSPSSSPTTPLPPMPPSLTTSSGSAAEFDRAAEEDGRSIDTDVQVPSAPRLDMSDQYRGEAAGLEGGILDTFRFVRSLEASGLRRGQAVAIMDQVLLAIKQSRDMQTFAELQDLQNTKMEISKEVFNATLRFDTNQRYNKSMWEKDLAETRSELRAELKASTMVQAADLDELEMKMLRRRQEDEQRFAALQNEIDEAEKRVFRYGYTGMVSIAGLGLGLARILS